MITLSPKSWLVSYSAHVAEESAASERNPPNLIASCTHGARNVLSRAEKGPSLLFSLFHPTTPQQEPPFSVPPSPPLSPFLYLIQETMSGCWWVRSTCRAITSGSHRRASTGRTGRSPSSAPSTSSEVTEHQRRKLAVRLHAHASECQAVK